MSSKKRKSKKEGENESEEFLFDRFSVELANECTGLIAAQPETAAERESYESIYPTNRPRKARRKKK